MGVGTETGGLDAVPAVRAGVGQRMHSGKVRDYLTPVPDIIAEETA